MLPTPKVKTEMLRRRLIWAVRDLGDKAWSSANRVFHGWDKDPIPNAALTRKFLRRQDALFCILSNGTDIVTGLRHHMMELVRTKKYVRGPNHARAAEALDELSALIFAATADSIPPEPISSDPIVTCPHCNGMGEVDDGKHATNDPATEYYRCGLCYGDGGIPLSEAQDHSDEELTVECPECDGYGCAYCSWESAVVREEL